MALSAAAISAISQAASTVGSAAAGYGGSYTSAKKSYKYGKKMFNLQNARQDYLMENENLIKRNALQKAGYSTADPNGTGVVTPQVGSVPTPHVDNPLGATAQGLANAGVSPLEAAQLDLAKSQADKNRAETDMQYILNDLKRVYGESEILTTLYNLDSQSFSNIANAMKADQDRLNSIQLTEAQVKDINEHLDMDWLKLEPELQIMCEQVENLKRDGKIKEAEEKKVWQDIRESNARISRIMKENELTDADIAVAKATVKLRNQELRTEKENTRGAKSAADAQKSEADIKKVEADARKALGPKYYAAKEVVDELTKTGERIGNTVSSFIPFTDKVETSHDVMETRYDRNGNVVGQKSTFSHDTRSKTSRRGN